LETPDLPSFPTRRSSDLSPRIYGGSLGYAVCRNPQENAGRITASTVDLVNFCRNGIANSRNRNSSLVAANSPIAIPPIHGIEVRSEEHTSELQSRFDLVC